MLGFVGGAVGVFRHQLLVGKSAVRVPIEGAQPRSGGSRLEEPVVFLDVFAMVPLRSGQAEESLFQDGVCSVPEGGSKAEALLPVADSENTVLPPSVGTAPSLLVGEIIPGVTIGAVVLAHRSPLAG